METTLYDLFSAFDPQRLSSIADDRARKEGHRLYEKQKIHGFEWIQPKQHLRYSSARCKVELANKDGALIGACACGGRLEGKVCSHIMAGLFTVCNILDDNRFRVLFRNNKFHEVLRRAYWSTQKHESNEVDHGEQHPELQVHADEDGSFRIRLPQKSYAAFAKAKDSHGDPLYRLTHLYRGAENVQSALLDYIQCREEPTPIVVYTPEQVYENVRWEPTLKTRAFLSLDLDPENRIRLAQELESEPSLSSEPSWTLLPPGLVLETRKRQLGIMKEYAEVWELFQSWSEGQDLPARERKIDLGDQGEFGTHASTREKALANVRCSRQGEVAPPRPLSTKVSVNLKREEETATYTLGLVVYADGERTLADAWFRRQLEPVLSPPSTKLSNEARRRKLSEILCVLLLEEDSIVGEVMRDKMLDAGLFSLQPVRESARRLLDKTIDSLFRLRHYFLLPHEGAWCDYEAPVRRLGYALAVSQRLLRVPLLNINSPYALECTEKQMLQTLNPLLSALEQRDIDLRLDGAPIRRVRLDVRLDAREGGGLDWFELREEVRFEGRIFPEKEWLSILEGGGVVNTMDGMAMVDPADLDVLDRIRRLLRLSSEPDTNGSREPVRVPRLQILEWLQLEKKGVQLSLRRKDRGILDALYSFQQITPAPLPQKLKTILRDYQRTGYDWLAFLYQHRFGACLADDMGLGKTVQAIALLAGLKEGVIKPNGARLKAKPHLIVVPSSLVFNWHHQIEHFYPELRVYEYLGPERSTQFGDFDVVLTTYGILSRDIGKLKKKTFHVMIADEAQAIKNIRAERTTAARELKAGFKLCLTGTPLENHIGEYYSILDLALPGLLGTYREFMATGDGLSTSELLQRAEPFVLRRTKDTVLKELPPKIEADVQLDLSDVQREFYTRTVEEVRSKVHEAYEYKPSAQAGIVALTALLRLRQICVSPRLLDPRIEEPSPKTAFLLDKLEELKSEGHAALVFSQFTRGLDLLEIALTEADIAFIRMDGKTPTAKRKELVERFQADDGPLVFLLSLKTGGVGLNLTRASYVFHVDPWWNPAVERQATDRTHRIGQNRTVFVTRMIMRHTVEEKMVELKRRKEAVFRAVVDGEDQQKAAGILTREDFEFLIHDGSV